MIDLHNGARIRQSRMVPLHSSIARVEEGTALKAVMEAGREVCKPVDGTGNEDFIGLALNNTITFGQNSMVEEVMVPASAPYVVPLAKGPRTDSIGIREMSTGAAFTTGGSAAAGTAVLSGKNLTFAAGDAGKALRIVYRYDMTMTEAQQLFGQAPIEDPQGMIRATGVLFDADLVYTSLFDLRSNFWVETPGMFYTGPNGTLSLENTGTALNHKIKLGSAPQPGGAIAGGATGLLGVRMRP